MKKTLYATLIFTGISVLFGVCYYFSFKNALIKYNREAVEQNSELLRDVLQSSGESERLLRQLLEEREDTYPVAVSQETLRENASYFLETCYLQSRTEEREQLALPGFMVGIDRRELKAYVDGYMDTMPVTEYLNGLISFEIVSFSEDKVVLRKTYDETKVENQFYICSKNGMVIVYYSDLKTVYEYTDISLDGLIDEVRQSIEQGFYVKDMQELYSILEGYTS